MGVVNVSNVVGNKDSVREITVGNNSRCSERAPLTPMDTKSRGLEREW